MPHHLSFEEVISKYGALAYTNVGTSMLPLIRQGRDVLTIIRKPQGRLPWLSVPLYKRPDGRYILHRVLWVKKDGYIICGDNNWRLECDVTDAQIVGILSSVKRGGRTYDMRSPLMRAYSLLQFIFFPVRAPFCYLRNFLRRLAMHV